MKPCPLCGKRKLKTIDSRPLLDLEMQVTIINRVYECLNCKKVFDTEEWIEHGRKKRRIRK